MKSVIGSMIDQLFTPKERSDSWRVFFGANTSSGYDFSLVIENPETEVTYLLEIGIADDGRLCGQISPDAHGGGSDALLIFDTTPDIATVRGNQAGPKLIIDANDKDGSKIIYDAKPAGFY